MDQLDLNDIKQAVNIIAVCTSRGTFKANELERVGRLYNKLDRYISKFNPVIENNDTTNESIVQDSSHTVPEHEFPEPVKEEETPELEPNEYTEPEKEEETPELEPNEYTEPEKEEETPELETLKV